jgi:hypothetical protein
MQRHGKRTLVRAQSSSNGTGGGTGTVVIARGKAVTRRTQEGEAQIEAKEEAK